MVISLGYLQDTILSRNIANPGYNFANDMSANCKYKPTPV